MKRIILTLLTTILFVATSDAATRKVLFIGNSYIYTNDVPNILRQLALSLGDTLVYDQNTIGGYTLQAHSTDATTISKIYSQQWDIVVIQEQSQRPAFPPSQVETDTYPYAHILDSMVHDNYACTQTMFMMTWGYKNGDQSNCGGYPILCTYNGMQARLRESYLEMTQDNSATVAPIGAAWKVVRDSFPTLELYSTDNSHPIVPGSYLEACVFYASIFHKAPNLSTYYAGVTPADAIKLQNVATHLVLDSLDSWQQYGNYTFANFTLAINDKTITLQNNSDKATGYAWDFGDLGNSAVMSPPPHTYANYGSYTVKLTSSNSCFSETKKQTINLNPVSISNLNKESAGIKVSNEYPGISVLSVTEEYERLEIFNINGQKISTYYPTKNSTIKLELSAGLYFCKAYRNNVTETMKFSML